MNNELPIDPFDHKRLQEFRRFYNSTLYPELKRMEYQRRRLLYLLGGSVVLLAVAAIITFALEVAFIPLLLSLPAGVYVIYLFDRVRRFPRLFKPRVMQLILEFLNDTPNYEQLEYRLDLTIPRERFVQSLLFKTKAPYYEAEDFIQGIVGELRFEMCEMDVKEISPATNRLDDIFTGIFIYGVMGEADTEGELAVYPRHIKNQLTKSIKNYINRQGAVPATVELQNEEFADRFIVYAKKNFKVHALLTEPMQDALLDYVDRTGRDIYVSFRGPHVYAAISEPRDLLEPALFDSNLSFDLVRDFYQDIELVLKLIQVFDQTH